MIKYFLSLHSHGENTGMIGVFVRKANFANRKVVAAGTPKKSTKIASSSSVFKSGNSPIDFLP